MIISSKDKQFIIPYILVHIELGSFELTRAIK